MFPAVDLTQDIEGSKSSPITIEEEANLEQKTFKENRECEWSHVFIPCRHLLCCGNCARKVGLCILAANRPVNG